LTYGRSQAHEIGDDSGVACCRDSFLVPVVERRLIPAREGVVVLLVGGMAAGLAGLGGS
jgi:hypothetical protein